MQALLAPLALLLERFIGYPRALYPIIRHPVVWMGALISLLDKRLNTGPGRGRGVVALLILLLVTAAVTVPIAWGLRSFPFGWVIEALLATTLLAQKELGRAVRAVADALGHSLDAGRQQVGQIVGRDTAKLDEAGVSRAAIETLAESASDGVIAPLFWLVIGGLPGIALYKAVNTADSMIGHKTERHRDFGWASARFDDVLNFLPARLTALLFCGAAFWVKGADAEKGWTTALRDAKKHASPNAGWPEAVVAGALGFALGGPRAYAGEVHDLPQFGEGRSDLGPADIRKAVELYAMMLNLAFGITLAIAILLWR
ncbi:MAG TPA: adenosylcobinamide-phosphate synthase CbiB [Devosia sp.]|nr:adenosylcobinamide-phosphate synthase CbiB [Devosia sp.]